MTRRFTRILITTLCCLVALATSASADCAWVLWGERDRGDWNPRVAYETRQACVQAMTAINGVRVVEPGIVMAADGTLYRCFPDTVDPRGPKGK
jgi:hypothetical protein